MDRSTTLAGLALAATLAACAHKAPPPPPLPPARTQDLAQADGDFAAEVARGDAAAFRARLSPDALFVGGSLLAGREAVWTGWSRYFAKDGPVLRWAPSAAGLARSGDLGWTTGSYVYESAPGSDGKREVGNGRYVTVWSRRADGSWAVELDMELLPPSGTEGQRWSARTLQSRDGSMEAYMGTWVSRPGTGIGGGAWITVRERGADGWRTVVDSAVPFPAP
jgi:ketosteroid isomerase-like protein